MSVDDSVPLLILAILGDMTHKKNISIFVTSPNVAEAMEQHILDTNAGKQLS